MQEENIQEAIKYIYQFIKEKEAYSSNLNVENIIDTKNFWKTVKKFFSLINRIILKVYLFLKNANYLSMILELQKHAEYTLSNTKKW